MLKIKKTKKKMHQKTKSKFANKYGERIQSIKSSDELAKKKKKAIAKKKLLEKKNKEEN